VGQVKDAATESLDGVSTVDPSIKGFKYRKTPADHVSVSNYAITM
jgi:hypothetical protein